MTRPRFDGSVSLIQKLTKELFLHFERKVKENSPEVSDNRMALEVLAFVHRYLKNGNEINMGNPEKELNTVGKNATTENPIHLT